MESAGSHRAKRNVLARALWLSILLGCASSPPAFGQGQNLEPIRVGSEQVVVPVYVADKERRSMETAHLAVTDFHIFEDGQEQKIQTLATEHTHIWEVDDSAGRHIEYSNSPRGKWSTAELSFTGFVGVDPTSFYLVGYQPPPSATGSCHHIEVKLDRATALVFSRSEYCNVQHPPSDPLNGTKFGGEIERDLESKGSGEIHLAVQARAFGGELPRVYVSIGFPWESLTRRWINGSLSATIGIVGLVYRKNGSLAASFSDQACCSSDVPAFVLNQTKLEAHPEFDVMLIPDRYETQLSLPPGEYELRVAIGDGRKFGRAVVPLTVGAADEKHLAVSDITLGTQYREVSAGGKAAVPALAEYAPLVGNGLEVAPAEKTQFRSNQPLAAYFEIYEPPHPVGPRVPVEAHLRIVNSKSGKVISELDTVKAGTDSDSSITTIPIAQFIPLHALAKGEYRLEVQATDAAGQSSSWRAANFVLDR